MSNLIPFDYQTWKTGNYDVVYRNGEVPLEWHWFEKSKELDVIVSICAAETMIFHIHNKNGMELIEQPGDYDLMLRPKDKWIEGYLVTNGDEWDGIWDSLERAKNSSFVNESILRIRWNPIIKQGTIEEV